MRKPGMAGVSLGAISILPLVASGGAISSINFGYGGLTLASLFWAIALFWLVIVWALEIKARRLSSLPPPMWVLFAVAGALLPVVLFASQFSEASLKFTVGTLLVWTIFLTATFQKGFVAPPKGLLLAVGLAGLIPGAMLVHNLLLRESSLPCLTCFAASQITPQIALASLGTLASRNRNYIVASLLISFSVFISVTVILSGSRAASLLSVFLLSHMFASLMATGRKSWALTAIIAPILTSAYFVWATSKTATGQRWNVPEGDISLPTLGGEPITTASSGRLAMWEELLSEPPSIGELFWGRGVGASELFARNLFSQGSWDSVHNDYLALWYDTGVVGFTLVMFVCSFAVVYAVKTTTLTPELNLTFLVALSVLWMALFESPTTSIYIVFPLAVLAFLGNKSRREG